MRTLVAITISSLLCCFILSFSFKSDEELQKDKLLVIAKEYLNYALVEKKTPDNKKILSYTVALCSSNSGQPLPDYCYNIDTNNFSRASGKISKHGDKLYMLYVRDYNSYADDKIKLQPVGQALVKETWNTTMVDSGYITASNIIARKNENDNRWYVPATRSHLFIMYKEEEKPGNDKGWVYGIVNIENGIASEAVLSHGKISNCIGCHQNTKYDRIFGITS